MWNKFCASSWLNTEIRNSKYCFTFAFPFRILLVKNSKALNSKYTLRLSRACDLNSTLYMGFMCWTYTQNFTLWTIFVTVKSQNNILYKMIRYTFRRTVYKISQLYCNGLLFFTVKNKPQRNLHTAAETSLHKKCTLKKIKNRLRIYRLFFHF